MKSGHVKHGYNPDRGYGFIVPDDGGPEVFFHGSILTHHEKCQLRAGLAVMFEDTVTQKGRRVSRIELPKSFTVLTLPPGCSHRYAVRDDRTEVVWVFHNMADVLELIGEPA